jgi:hypothetical protein
MRLDSLKNVRSELLYPLVEDCGTRREFEVGILVKTVAGRSEGIDYLIYTFILVPEPDGVYV